MDAIRGMVMFVLLIVHVDIFSVYNLLVWERIGVVSGGEGFVILSGIILGMVYRKKIERRGFRACVSPLINRACQLYRLNLVMIGLVAFMGMMSFWDASSIMQFEGGGEVYPLFPSPSAPLKYKIGKAVLLRCGPHQFQIMGLYVVLLFLTPIALWVFSKGRTGLFLAVSWILYFKNWAFPSMPTGAQFEYAFPVLTWQLTFFHGLAYGYHKEAIHRWFRPGLRQPFFVAVISLVFGAFLVWTQSNPNPAMPEWARANWIPPDLFRQVYADYFTKNKLGILRLVNYLAVLVVGYVFLTQYWKPFCRAFGWWLIPIGQASLYVFFVHVFLVMAVDNVPWFNQGNMWANTVAHTAVLMAVWAMVKTRFLFRWIPR